jgi:hypothetical protein
MKDHRKKTHHDRLKQALRENLKRRKAQAKSRTELTRGNDRSQRNSVETHETDSDNEA